MKICAAILLLFTCFTAYAQPYSVSGILVDEKSNPVASAEIAITQKGKLKLTGKTNKEGAFNLDMYSGRYMLTITSTGYKTYEQNVTIADSNINLGTIHLQLFSQALDEVSIVAQALAMVQKDDTVEYNSGAYKVNPDADAADLVRKMPSIELNDKKLTAQGEKVIKVLVDGKPFFGEDPYATLKNLPADIIDKVQVYNEKSDQERFTGFSEGPINKTINIVTKRGKQKGVFGNVFGGGGTDDNKQGIYGTGLTLNRFDGDKRVTLTGQANNVNIRNFSEQGATENTGSTGITTTQAAGVNYSDKWGKKMDVSGSYFYNATDNSVDRQMRRAYVLPTASGQVYEESSPSSTDNINHRLGMRISYAPDTVSTLLWQPGFTVNDGNGVTAREGATVMGIQPLNETINNNTNTRSVLSVSNSLLYTRKFSKRGRTFSTSINASNSANNTETIQYARNIYYTNTLLNDTLDQRVLAQQQSWNVAGNAVWTEPVSKSGLLKLQYNITYAPSNSDRNAYERVSDVYSNVPDSLLSNTFASRNTAHKTGASYLYKKKDYEVSIGVNYQVAVLINEQQMPAISTTSRTFSNVLPVATFQYRFSKRRNLQCNYTTNTSTPSITQLQDVVNNADPLHLSTGNPALKQPYNHSLSARYNTSGDKGQNNISASLTGNYTQHYITSGLVVATSDTAVGQIVIPAGAQLSIPVNISGNRSLTGNISYSQPIRFIKSRVNININGGINNMPSIINNVINYQRNTNMGAGLSLNSNISENVDFLISSNTIITRNDNPVNRQLNSTFTSEICRASLNLILWKGIVINSSVTYQANFGLSAGYNVNYMLWNIAVGKKLFRKRQGDIRVSVFDVLKKNNSIQRSVTETYIQDMQSNILQRYFMLVFTYKISKFS